MQNLTIESAFLINWADKVIDLSGARGWSEGDKVFMLPLASPGYLELLLYPDATDLGNPVLDQPALGGQFSFLINGNRFFTGQLVTFADAGGQHAGYKRAIFYDALEAAARTAVDVEYSPSETLENAIGTLAALVPIPVGIVGNPSAVVAEFGKRWDAGDSVWAALQDLAGAFFGRMFVDVDGDLCYYSYDVFESDIYQFSNDVVADFYAVATLETTITRALLKVFPPDISGSQITLWELRSPAKIPALSSRVIRAGYRDANGLRCAAHDVVTPVATTNFLLNSQKNGGGSDMTSSVGISFEILAREMVWTITNPTAQDAYLVFAEVEGKAIYEFDPVAAEYADFSSYVGQGDRTFSASYVAATDLEFAQAVAEYVVRTHQSTGVGYLGGGKTWCRRVDFYANSEYGGRSPYAFELQECWAITEAASGLSGQLHRIWRIEYVLDKVIVYFEPLFDLAIVSGAGSRVNEARVGL